MILGIGTDIIEIIRIEESIAEHGDLFLFRLFTPKEQAYCDRFKHAASHYAGRFAAKEAIAKALGVGIGAQLSWHDIEILFDELGKPVVHLSETAKSRYQNPNILLSISHCKAYAQAVAIWQQAAVF